MHLPNQISGLVGERTESPWDSPFSRITPIYSNGSSIKQQKEPARGSVAGGVSSGIAGDGGIEGVACGVQEEAQEGTSSYHITYTQSRNSLLLMLPEGFTQGFLSRAFQAGAKTTKVLWPKAAFFVSSLIERTAQNTNPECVDAGVPVNAHLWQRMLGHKYSTQIKDGLVQCGVIEQTAAADRAAKKSARYRIGPEFLNQRLRWETVRSVSLAQRFRRQSGDVLKVAATLGGGRRSVWENLQHVGVSPKLIELLGNPEGLSMLDQARLMLVARAVGEKKFWLAYPHRGDRLYHSVACVQTKVREHLLIDGEEVCEADMSCAQPFLCLALYPTNGAQERQRFGAAVSTGGLYEMLRDALPDKERREALASWERGGRDKLKKEVCRSILFAGMSYPLPPLFVAFTKLFPVLAEILRARRRTKTGANALASELRCREASLMFDKVIPRIHAAVGGCIPVSIHDAIMCQRRFAPEVVRIIGDEAEKMFGVRPNVSVKGRPRDRLGIAVRNANQTAPTPAAVCP